MNKAYKVLFNRVRGVATAVSEIASGNQARKKTAVALAVTLAIGVMEGGALAAQTPVDYYGKHTSSSDEWVKNGGTASNFKQDWTQTSGEESGNAKNLYGGYASQGKQDVTDNIVTVTGGTIKGDVYSAYTLSGSANDNALRVTGGTIATNGSDIAIAGGFTASTETDSTKIQSASFNQVIIDGGTLKQGSDNFISIYGGYADHKTESTYDATANVSDNCVMINGMASGSSVGYVYGGYTRNGSAGGEDYYISDTSDKTRGNIVYFIDGTVNDSVVGGFVNSRSGGSANYNIVDIEGGVITNHPGADRSEIVGGLTVSDGSGLEKNPTASHNAVIINGGTFTPVDNQPIEVYGGWAERTASVSANVVAINKMTAGSVNNVYGGYSKRGSAGGDTYFGSTEEGKTQGNYVVMKGGTVDGSIYGGFSENDSVTDNAKQSANFNAVEIKGGTFTDSDAGIYGGAVSLSSNQSATGVSATASHNRVSISGGTFNKQNVYGGYTWLGDTVSGTQIASENSVVITGRTSGSLSRVYGGYSYGATESGEANNNEVTVSGGKIKTYVTGGDSESDGTSGDTNSNKVTVIGVTVGRDVTGGYSYGESLSGNANDNTVTVSGGKIRGDVTGGDSESDATSGEANNNKVTVIGVTVGRDVTGGYSYGEFQSGEANTNTVIVSAGQINRYVSGGCTESDATSGNANSNKVMVSGGKIKGDVSGGYSYGVTESGEANNNEVTVSGGKIKTYVTGGDSESDGTSGDTNSNKVTVIGATVGRDVTGGFSYGESDESGDANNNTVTVKRGIVGRDVTGGYSYGATESGNANNNTVTVSGGKIRGDVTGGDSESDVTSGQANCNTVTVSRGNIKGDVTGGDSESDATSGNANSNKVMVSGGKIKGDVSGGYSYGATESGEANNNEVTVSAGKIGGYVMGGWAKSANTSGNTNDNTVTVSGVTVDSGVTGGGTESKATSGDANNNMVTVSGSLIKGDVTGGYSYGKSESGDANNNTVSVSAGKIKGYVTGGSAESDVTAGNTNNNKVTVSGGKITYDVAGGSSYGKSSSGNANGNTVTVSGGRINAYVMGGCSYGASDVSGDANNNAVTVSEGEITHDVAGGYSYGAIKSGYANNNTVTVSGGTITAYVTGGLVKSDDTSRDATKNLVTVSAGTISGFVTGGYCNGASKSGDAIKNTVTVSAGTIGGYVIGGWVKSADKSGDAYANTVTVNGGIINSSVAGGYSYGASESGHSNNNTVTVSGGSIDGYVMGGWSASAVTSGTANNNTVTVSAGTIRRSVTGGVSSSGSAGTSEGTGNTVTLSGTAVLKNESITVSSGQTRYFGATGGWSGGTTATTANYNTVTVKDSVTLQYTGKVYEGGTVYAGVFGGLNESTSKNSCASHNSVNIEGGSITLDFVAQSIATHDTMHQGIYGGYASSGFADNNTVIFNGGIAEKVWGGMTLNSHDASASYNAVIWKNGTISKGVYGGTGYNNAPAAVSDGNTLVVTGSGKSTEFLGGFQNYLFLLDETTNDTKNTSKATLTAGSEGAGNPKLELFATDKIGVAFTKDAAVNLHENDKIVLMTVKSGLTDASTSRVNQVSEIRTDLKDNACATAWLKSNFDVESKVNKYEFSLATEELDSTTEGVDSLVATVTGVAPSVVVSNIRQTASGTAINFRSQINDVASRMGDLRLTNSDGLWARVYGGKYTLGDGMKEKSVTLQVGGDKWVNENTYVGLTGSYTKADDTLNRGDNDQKVWNFGVYGGYLAENGMYVDAIAKHGRIGNDFTLAYENGDIVKGKYHTWGTSLSVEGGWRLDCPKTSFYVEPQVELMYGHLQSVNFSADGIDFRHDGVDTLVGRVGAAVGYKFAEQKGGVHFKASLLHDFKGEVKTEARAGSETDGGSTRDLGGTWGEFTLGVTYRVTDKFNVYNQMKVSTKAAGVRTKWQGSLGMRYMF